MVRIAPVRLDFNPRVLWFDAVDLPLNVDDRVVVNTVRGHETGRIAQAVFEMPYEETKKLKSPLRSVSRIATEEDAARADELATKAQEALPVFRRMAAEMLPDMSPVAVEYLFDGDKAVFYFESEERLDFRELVRRLAAEFHVRVDMKQVGIRDGARMVGGLGHCGQELCCRRLGGEFNPVSIRMAKEQDLSLNPQKISGVCGRLMCCLRYEYDAYKDFHARAPKKNAKIDTPVGEGRVVALDVPREIVSIQVDDEKPVKVPLADMNPADEGARPTSVGRDAWAQATAPAAMESVDVASLFSAELSGQDKLADRGSMRRVHEDDEGGTAKRKRRRRRRSTTVSGSDNASEKNEKASSKTTQKGQKPRNNQKGQAVGSSRSGGKARNSAKTAGRSGGQRTTDVSTGSSQGRSTQVGRNSSALRSGRGNRSQDNAATQDGSGSQAQHRRRRRTHRTGSAAEASKQEG